MTQVQKKEIKISLKYHDCFSEAMAGSDYTSVASTEVLTFSSASADSATRCVEILIIDDSALERDQTFTVILETSFPGVLLGNTETTLNIADNDG